MRDWIDGFFMAWGMFLSLPCPVRRWKERAREKMLLCLPAVGGVVGLLWTAVAWGLQRLLCPKPLEALILAVLPWLATGFLHLDGFLDVCDALLSRRDLEGRQRILKDSHCGAFAVVCMVLLAGAQWSLFASAPWVRLLPMGAVPVAVRACAALAVLLLRPMKASQYGSMEKGGRGFLVVPGLCLLVACVIPPAFCGLAGLAPLAAALVFSLAAWHGYRQLDGMSGDISGFALTLGELAGVAVVALVR